jgi:hypothetical protein
MVSSMTDVSGGTNYKSGNGNGKRQKQKEEKIQIPIFKYTARFKKPLHEAILLGNEAFFLTWNQQKQVMEHVHHIEETKRILRPPDEGEYPYEPIEFESLAEIKEYAELAQHETMDSLYQKVKPTVALYVDQEEDIITLIAADVIWTWFQDLFPTTHYYDVNGKANGIGKSTIGHMFECIGYRGVRMTDPSAANLFRVLGQIEPGQCIIIADEADRIHQDKDALSIMKEGYGRFGKVPKINTNSLKQEFYYCYCFKVRIAEDPLSGKITKGVIDRSFQIRAIRGLPTHDIKEVSNPASRTERLQKLHNDLKHLRKLLLCYRLIHFDDPIADIDVGLDGRDKELCKPLLQLFYGSKAYDEVRTTALTFLNRKNKRKKNTAVESILFDITVNLLADEGTKNLTIAVDRMWEVVTDRIPGMRGVPGMYDPKKPNEYQTYDYDTIYRTTMSKTMESFGAEHDKQSHKRVLVFDRDRLSRMSRQFDVEPEVQTKIDYVLNMSAVPTVPLSPTKNDGNVLESTTGSISDNENITQSEDENYEEVYGDRGTAGTAAMSKNDIKMSSDGDGVWSCAYCIISNRIEDTNKITGFHTLSDYQKHIMKSHRNLATQKNLTFDPEPLDLEKFESEFIAEKQKQNKSKSKVTEMAEANESGNGVMFHGNGEVKKSKLAEMTEANESGKGVLFEGNEKGAT